MATVGSGQYTYELVERWGTLPSGWTFGPVSAVATDSQDRVYAFQRKDPPVLIFDRLGNYLGSWGDHSITDPHGFYIKNDIVYLTDRDDHVVLKYTLDGKPLALIGERGKASDTGCESDGGRVLRAAGPFNKPTEIERTAARLRSAAGPILAIFPEISAIRIGPESWSADSCPLIRPLT